MAEAADFLRPRSQVEFLVIWRSSELKVSHITYTQTVPGDDTVYVERMQRCYLVVWSTAEMNFGCTVYLFYFFLTDNVDFKWLLEIPVCSPAAAAVAAATNLNCSSGMSSWSVRPRSQPPSTWYFCEQISPCHRSLSSVHGFELDLMYWDLLQFHRTEIKRD